MEPIVLLALTIPAAIVISLVLGVIGFIRAGRAQRRIDQLSMEVWRLSQRVERDGIPPKEAYEQPVGQAGAPRPERPAAGVVTAAPEPPAEPPSTPLTKERGASSSTPSPTPPPAGPPPVPPRPQGTTAPVPEPAVREWWNPDIGTELLVGTRWVIWLGAFMFLGGVGFALKYSYDNALIGPAGRLAIGVLVGTAALAGGEYLRRMSWRIPFMAFTGGAFAIYYLCVYFAFHVYGLSGQDMSMTLAVAITAAAVLLAVAHDALPIALLAVVGGFLSPVLMSSGGNHPWTLFTYVAVLDLVAVGAALFRRWRALDLVCFAGTALLYQAWFVEYYSYAAQEPGVLPPDLAPALFFTTLFYVIFLAVPMLYNLVRRMPEVGDSLALVVVNALFSLYCYYNVLFHEYRQALGFVVVGQAVLVLLLHGLWVKRTGGRSQVAEALLWVALVLVTLAIPLQLRLYGIPIAWAAEGALLTYLGLRFGKLPLRVGGGAALLLAAGGLVYRLPLHELPYLPVLNRPFGAWAVVIALAATAAACTWRKAKADDMLRLPVALGGAGLALVLTCVLLTLETAQYWPLEKFPYWPALQGNALTVLWAAIPLALAGVVYVRRIGLLAPVAWAGLAVGAAMCLHGLTSYGTDPEGLTALVLNPAFLSRALFIGAAWGAARLLQRVQASPVNAAAELMGHMLLAVVAWLELARWAGLEATISRNLAFGLLGAVWAVQGCALIWYGLITRQVFRRYAGFTLFAIAAGKTIVIDTFELAEVYRIVSWLGSGALLVTAALLYQRYSPLLLKDREEEDK